MVAFIDKHFRNIAKTALVLVYLVIIAGAVVRMTGSGMGCPDWPKCFGYFIPPTEEYQIQFQPNYNYEQGTIIIEKEALWVAKQNFTSAKTLNTENWEPYTAHDYAKFNAVHTWIEYINRLIGALSGIPILIFTILSFWFWKKNKWITILSVITVFGMGFQAWLGKTVVDSNLAPYKITIHMVMAIVIVAFILYVIYASKTNFKKRIYHSLFSTILLVAIALSLIQIILGTQVRQHVDEQVKAIGYLKAQWMAKPTISFYIHRTFSVLVLATNVWLFYTNKKRNLGFKKMNLVFTFIVIEIITGILMYYFNFPFLSQPMHIVVATILIGIQFYVYLLNLSAIKLKSDN